MSSARLSARPAGAIAHSPEGRRPGMVVASGEPRESVGAASVIVAASAIKIRFIAISELVWSEHILYRPTTISPEVQARRGNVLVKARRAGQADSGTKLACERQDRRDESLQVSSGGAVNILPPIRNT